MKVYCYAKCSTCKKALDFLKENQIKYESIDIKGNHPSPEEIQKWHEKSGLPLKKFFNTSGLVYKEMELKDKLPDLSLEEQYQLLGSNGMLLKRPILLTENLVLLGFKQKEWEEKLGLS